MFKNHPKGLLSAALANMGERFGFYIMMAILLLFLNNKFGFTGSEGAIIYSVFYALIYVLALVGGLIADKTRKYKSTILVGLLLMTVGYFLLAIPTKTPVENMPLILALTCFGLFSIAFGNGLFKGNLQAVVGQLYDNPKYEDKREVGFQIFYMFINVGAMFAPLMAVGLRNWWVKSHGFEFNADLPRLCNQWVSGSDAMTADAKVRFAELATKVGGDASNLDVFANDYLNIFMQGYHYSFGIAIIAMVISLTIFIINKKKLPDPSQKKVAAATSTNEVVEMDAKEVKQRIYALFAVFAVVIFFWFSFHQNGQSLTLFANDYTKMLNINLGFTTLQGAEVFQAFNPIFVVFLTPIVIGFFGWLKARGLEISTPKKIAIGMGIAAAAFAVMSLGSIGLPTAEERLAMGGIPDAMRVTPWLLIGTYLILTVAELFISPLGIAFVSKVAPPKYQGIMQGGWLSATALGNQLLFIGVIFYNSIPVWATWTIFVTACLISMFTMIFMLKWLERVAK
ncbi:MAG: peptide MFS transporter [Bacteroidales bacterium]|nr:peptide MFS transporter [Bacteroidales bacterium]MDD4702831.1 peptide MFS transporter [Bacteroidales bacterium]